MRSLTVAIADIHAGLVRDTWWLRPDAAEVTERSIANVSQFLLASSRQIRRVIFNGDILHAWRASDYDPELAKKQLEPLRSALQTLRVPVIYVEGNADDQIGAASEEQKRAIFDGVPLEFPGLTWKDEEEGILAVHGHIFDPKSKLFPRFTLSKEELTRSLEQALSGDKELARALCQRSLDRHSDVVKSYGRSVKLLRKVLPTVLASRIERHINRSKDAIAESLFPASSFLAVNDLQIRTLILSHTHVPSIHATKELPLEKHAGSNLEWIANTGTPNRRQDARGTFLIIENAKPMLMQCYDPRKPLQEVIAM